MFEKLNDAQMQGVTLNAYDRDCAWLDAIKPECSFDQKADFSEWVTRIFNDGYSEDESREKVFAWMFFVDADFSR